MNFVKMQSYGNDFIFIETLTHGIGDPHRLSKYLCDRHFGVGGDGLVLVCPSEIADFKMRIFNPDGSEAEMCGNALRSSGKFVYDYSFTNKTEITFETLGGINKVFLETQNSRAVNITANIGSPVFGAEKIPVKITNGNGMLINYPINIIDRIFEITAVSFGNPHCGVYCPDVMELDIKKYGPAIETHEIFPNKTNVMFYNIIDEKTIRLRTWERNLGETLACGIGCCVSLLSAHLRGFCGTEAEVVQLGGSTFARYDKTNNDLYMTAPSNIVFEGDFDENTINER